MLNEIKLDAAYAQPTEVKVFHMNLEFAKVCGSAIPGR